MENRKNFIQQIGKKENGTKNYFSIPGNQYYFLFVS